jgi:hypothetical protein
LALQRRCGLVNAVIGHLESDQIHLSGYATQYKRAPLLE